MVSVRRLKRKIRAPIEADIRAFAPGTLIRSQEGGYYLKLNDDGYPDLLPYDGRVLAIHSWFSDSPPELHKRVPYICRLSGKLTSCGYVHQLNSNEWKYSDFAEIDFDKVSDGLVVSRKLLPSGHPGTPALVSSVSIIGGLYIINAVDLVHWDHCAYQSDTHHLYIWGMMSLDERTLNSSFAGVT